MSNPDPLRLRGCQGPSAPLGPLSSLALKSLPASCTGDAGRSVDWPSSPRPSAPPRMWATSPPLRFHARLCRTAGIFATSRSHPQPRFACPGGPLRLRYLIFLLDNHLRITTPSSPQDRESPTALGGPGRSHRCLCQTTRNQGRGVARTANHSPPSTIFCTRPRNYLWGSGN